jgi:hypothetical protein
LKAFDTPGEVTVTVGIGAGEIAIETFDERRVAIEAFAVRDDDATRAALDVLRIEHAERAGRHEVRVEVPRKRGGILGIGRGPSIGLRIRCPHGSDLDVASSSADLDARGSYGAVGMKTASGDVVLETVGGPCDVATASGDAVIRSSGGTLRVKTASGDCDVARAAGPVSANLVSGDLRIGEAFGEVIVNSVSGDVRVEAVAASVKIASVSGDVRLGVTEGLKLWIDASSVSGTMSSDLDVVDGPPDEDGPLVEIRARTVSGDLHIGRAPAAVSAG